MTDIPADGPVRLDSSTGRLIIAATVLGSAVAQLAATVVNVALPTLAADLNIGSAGQQWVNNAYLVTLASFILIGGSLGDRFGRRLVYRVGVAWFAVASLACAVAPAVDVLIAARLLQGVGGALLTPGSLAIIEASLVREDRGRGVGAWSGLGGVAGAIGPLVGGLVVEWSWRWAFVINLPIAVAVLVLSPWLPETSDPTAREAPLDVVGAGLSALLLGGISYALIEGAGGSTGWRVWPAAGLAVIALVGLVAWERGRPGAMLPIDLFAVRPFVAANAVTLVVYGGLGVVFFLLSIQLQVSAGWSPVAAGAALLPVTVIMLVLSSWAGAAATRIGPPLAADRRTAGHGRGYGHDVGHRARRLVPVRRVPGHGRVRPRAGGHGGAGAAVRVAAGMVAFGGVLAVVMFRADDLAVPEAAEVEPTSDLFQCGVDGPVIRRRSPAP